MSKSRRIILGIFIYALAFLVFRLNVFAASPSPTPTPSPQNAVSKPITSKTPSMTEAPATKPKPKKTKRGFSRIYAEFHTTLGTFKALLHHTRAPQTVENFVALAEGKKEWTHPKTRALVKTRFYDGLIFHRVIKNFIIQSGDPLGLDPKRAGSGGPGYKINDEFHPDLVHDKAGILSMASSNSPNTNGSQFFITLSPQPNLDKKHSVFGEIVEGMDVVKKIGNTPTDRRTDRPVEPVVIKKLKIIRE